MENLASPSLILKPPSRSDQSVSDWFTPIGTKALEKFIGLEILKISDVNREWQAARLSSAVYIYREMDSLKTIIAKFYSVKTGSEAEKYANREIHFNKIACEIFRGVPAMRAVIPLGVFRGVLLLEHIEGLTLEDTIAVRRSHPGILRPALESAADLLKNLHRLSPRPNEMPSFDPAAQEARKIVDTLSKHGVLKRRPFLRRKLSRLIDVWQAKHDMSTFSPCLIHGDATSTNFVIPQKGGIVAIDWERAKITDPAADLGRLLAEVSHAIKQEGGNPQETARLVEIMRQRYISQQESDGDSEVVLHRARFYQGSSTLRIARNGWLSRTYRKSLIEKALGLLSDPA
jgi:thiamine kinase-like enzyme